MKRVLCLSLVLTMLCAMLIIMPVTAATIVDSGTCGAEGDNLKWTLDSEGTLTISGNGRMKDNHTPWMKVKDKTFKIIIESEVTNIGELAFTGFYYLTDIVISDSVTNIGNGAFLNCNNLKSIYIPNNVKSIGDNAFYGCSNLEKISMGNGLESIGASAFYECHSLKDIDWSSSLSYIGEYAFVNCENIIDVPMLDQLSYIGSEAFYNCKNLINIELPNHGINIGGYVFLGTPLYDDTNNWENDMLYIGNHIIAAKRGIKKCEIKPGTLSVADAAFSNLYGNTGNDYEIFIPESVVYIGTQTFPSNGPTVSVSPQNNNYSSVDSVLFDKDKTKLISYINNPNIREYTIPDSVESIEDHSFQGCNLSKITVPDSVTHIGSQAFFGSDNLSEIILSDRITSIDANAFDYTAYYNDQNNWENNVLYIGEYLIKANSVTGKYKIRLGTFCIADEAFSDCTTLAEIEFAPTIVSIGNGAFSNCKGLTNITLNNDIKYIGEKAFYYCSNIQTATLGNNLIVIGDSAFKFCNNLSKVIFGNKITNIAYDAFVWCKISDVYYEGSRQEWSIIDIDAGNEELLKAIIHCSDGDINNTYAVPSVEITEVGEDCVTAKVNNCDDTDAQIILAVYNKNGALIEMQQYYNFGEMTFYSANLKNSNIKVMLWSDLDSIKPLAETAEMSL